MDSSHLPKPPERPMPEGNPQVRMRKTGILLKLSPFVHDDTISAICPPVPGTTGEDSNVTLIRPKTVRIVDEKIPQYRTTAKKSLTMAAKEFKPGKISSEGEIYQGQARRPSVSNRNGLFDAKSEKSHSYLKAGGKAMKSSVLYQESANQCNDVVEARRKLRQLQINYSKTNANLNDRVIMCDILKVTFHQVIPRIKLMSALERRLFNLRLRSRRRILAMGEDTKNMTKTICELKKEREERIKNKQRPPRKVDTLKTVSAEDIEKLRTCFHLGGNGFHAGGNSPDARSLDLISVGRMMMNYNIKGQDWDSTNAEALMRYTASKGYKVNLELGNEPNLYRGVDLFRLVKITENLNTLIERVDTVH